MKSWLSPRGGIVSPCSMRMRCVFTLSPHSTHKAKPPACPHRLPRWRFSTKAPCRRVRMVRSGAGKRAGQKLRCQQEPKYGPSRPDGTIPSGSSRSGPMVRPVWHNTARKKDDWPNGVHRRAEETLPRSPQLRRRIISWPRWLFRTVNAPWPSGAGAMAKAGNMSSTKRSRIVRASDGVTGLWRLRMA